jgi:predicted MPP superfamily phosphohydrolase
MLVSKEKKLFSPLGLVIISFFLFLGIFFAYQEKTGKLDAYLENKYFSASFKPLAFKIYHIGFVTDAHAKFSTSAAGIKMASKIPMQSFVSEMNDIFHPDFVVDGGDFIDGTRRFGEKSMQDFSLFSKIFEEIQAPKYRVLGNHELRGMSRETWIKENNYEKSYYYFDYENLRVIVFDSTLVSGIKNSTFEYEKQYIWLEDILKNSKGYKKIIFTHYPFIPALRKAMPLQEVEKFNKLVSQYGVRAVFSGHVEVPFYEKIILLESNYI